MKRTSLLVLLVVLLVLVFVGYRWRNSPLFDGSSQQGQLIAQAHYQCDAGKIIDAAYYQGAQAAAVQPGEMPVPTGSAQLTLSDGRSMALKQTISADGVRYSDGDPQKQQGQKGAETFVFWSKGNGALVLENNEQKSYTGCIKVTDDFGGLPQVYESGSRGLSLRYPTGYKVDEAFEHPLSPTNSIRGVKFAIDPSIAAGTNLSADSYLSVEQIASSTSCAASQFFDTPTAASNLTDGSVSYSYASSSDAAAGNRYEEQVFALPGTNPCIAVRYLIHWGAFENFPAGTVRQFDKQALINQFDSIRRTLVVNQ